MTYKSELLAQLKAAEKREQFFHNKLNYAITWIEGLSRDIPIQPIEKLSSPGILELLKDWTPLTKEIK